MLRLEELYYYFWDFAGALPHIFNEAPWRHEVKIKEISHDLIYCWELIEKSSWKFGIYDKIYVFEWQGAIFYCINQVKSGKAIAVPETSVCKKKTNYKAVWKTVSAKMGLVIVSGLLDIWTQKFYFNIIEYRLSLFYMFCM